LHASTRDEPVNLSVFDRRLISIGRQPMPIAASRCYFDPNTTISIDLRERLFLLVTGR
jgi:hypothetical protein